MLKRQFGHGKVRYREFTKNTAQLVTLFVLGTQWMAERRWRKAGGMSEPAETTGAADRWRPLQMRLPQPTRQRRYDTVSAC